MKKKVSARRKFACRIGQTWKLPSGEVVQVLTDPDAKGQVECYSYDAMKKRTYNAFVFNQPLSVLYPPEKLDELRRGRSAPRGIRSEVRDLLKELIREIIVDIASEGDER